jgi:hypothetical protein
MWLYYNKYDIDSTEIKEKLTRFYRTKKCFVINNIRFRVDNTTIRLRCGISYQIRFRKNTGARTFAAICHITGITFDQVYYLLKTYCYNKVIRVDDYIVYNMNIRFNDNMIMYDMYRKDTNMQTFIDKCEVKLSKSTAEFKKNLLLSTAKCEIKMIFLCLF